MIGTADFDLPPVRPPPPPHPGTKVKKRADSPLPHLQVKKSQAEFGFADFDRYVEQTDDFQFESTIRPTAFKFEESDGPGANPSI